MQLRNRKISSSLKHQYKILQLNKQYFQNEYSNEQSKYSSYIDPVLAGCKDAYDDDNSINLQIFLKNIFLFIMMFSMYATIFTYSLYTPSNYAANYSTNYSNISKFELVVTKPDYIKNNLDGLKIVSMVFSTNNIKTKLILQKNLKNIYKSLIRYYNQEPNVNTIYPKVLSYINNYTNTSMFKVEEYLWMKNGSINSDNN